jgi:hypothetical protein
MRGQGWKYHGGSSEFVGIVGVVRLGLAGGDSRVVALLAAVEGVVRANASG